MLKRYTLPPMQKLWSEDEKFRRWLDGELAVLRARVTLGTLSTEAYDAISRFVEPNTERITELEEVFEHDMLAFIEGIQETFAGDAAPFKGEFHKGLTSYDIEDPALVLLLRETCQLILAELEKLERALRQKAREHRWTLMIARTHGQFAEPTTFGHLLLVFAEAISRSIQRLKLVLAMELSEGKISGAVGIYGGMNPEVEKWALAELHLEPAKAETQILQRDRHAMLLSVLAVAAGTIEQMARTFWELMRSEVRELKEPRKQRQRGSSAMPHKDNPFLNERSQGLAREVRACALAALENIATPEWRDISQSSVERHIFPTATGLVHYMVSKMTYLVANLRIFPERMRKCVEETSLGVWAGQPVRLALMEAGVAPDCAYKYVQQAAFEAEEKETHLREVLSQRPLGNGDKRTALDILGRDRLTQCFDARAWIERGISHIFREEY